MKKRLTLRSVTEQASGSDRPDHDSQVHRYELNPRELLKLLLQRRRWIFGVVGTVVLLTVAVMLATPNRYTSGAVILPSGKSGGFSALKAMAGLAGAFGTNDDNSSVLYSVFLSSPLVKDSLLAKAYTFEHDGRDTSLTLREYIGLDDPDELRIALSNITSTSSSTRTGEITIAVETRYPALSQALVNEYLAQLENYNLHSRRSEAKERIRYLGRELDERQRLLAEAEDSLGVFQSRNRNWANTTGSTILKELGRRERAVTTRSQTLVFLMQEYEAAR